MNNILFRFSAKASEWAVKCDIAFCKTMISSTATRMAINLENVLARRALSRRSYILSVTLWAPSYGVRYARAYFMMAVAGVCKLGSILLKKLVIAII